MWRVLATGRPGGKASEKTTEMSDARQRPVSDRHWPLAGVRHLGRLQESHTDSVCVTLLIGWCVLLAAIDAQRGAIQFVTHFLMYTKSQTLLYHAQIPH